MFSGVPSAVGVPTVLLVIVGLAASDEGSGTGTADGFSTESEGVVDVETEEGISIESDGEGEVAASELGRVLTTTEGVVVGIPLIGLGFVPELTPEEIVEDWHVIVAV